jgi:chitin synthase
MSSSNYYSDQQSTRPSISTNSTSKSSSTIGTTSGIPLVPPLPQFLNTRSNDNRVQFSNPAATSKPSLNVPQSQFKSDNLNDNHTHQGYSEANEFIRRKKSLVRPERERINEQHRLFNYRNHAAAAELEGRIGGPGAGNYTGLDYDDIVPNRAFQDSTNLRRGKSILAREEGMANESGLSMFKRGATLRRPNVLRGNSESAGGNASAGGINGLNEKNRLAPKVKQPLGPWMIFCLTVTICCPFPMLKWFGKFPSRFSHLTTQWKRLVY